MSLDEILEQYRQTALTAATAAAECQYLELLAKLRFPGVDITAENPESATQTPENQEIETESEGDGQSSPAERAARINELKRRVKQAKKRWTRDEPVFLNEVEVQTLVAAAYLECTPKTIQRHLKSGKLLPGPSNSEGTKWIDTISIVAAKFGINEHGETEEIEDR